jgi:predicted Zn-ribbon and HTH transcriptional regulator
MPKKPKWKKSMPKPLPLGESKPGRLPAERVWPHPGPYKRRWLGCWECGYHWFPNDDVPARCPFCTRDLDRPMRGKGVPDDPRAMLLCKCYRCGYEWFARKRVPLLPKYCGNPKCTSPFWGWPRVLAPGMPWNKADRTPPKRRRPVRRAVRRVADGIPQLPTGFGEGGLQL